ncbi:MAG: 3-methyl-2-oxobutanoate hydroxymethyltransferase [Proteobacteria bacterium]|nr:MAG: 3-methyl-2-oxobutanoate hydroxymethyltransferase [Pseudomonadota bacterium]
MTRLTVFDLRARRGTRVWSFLRVDSLDHCRAAEAAGIELIGTAFDGSTRHFPASAPGAHFRFGLPYGRYCSTTEILRGGFDAMECGADTVYTAQSLDMVSALAREGIPVIGHVGLVPPKAGWTGGYRAVGKTAAQALGLYAQIRAYEDAGAVGVELELVPWRVAEEITRRTSLITMSLGSGSGCDVQCLFARDVLGETECGIPRHAKAYRDFTREYARLEKERIAAFEEFADEVEKGAFPTRGHILEIPDHEFDEFLSGIERLP